MSTLPIRAAFLKNRYQFPNNQLVYKSYNLFLYATDGVAEDTFKADVRINNSIIAENNVIGVSKNKWRI